jgi:hypothetical protein
MATQCCNDTISSGLVLGCDQNTPGLRGIFISDFCNLVAVEHDSPDDYKIADITLASGAQYWEFQFYKETGQMQSNLKVNDNGSTYYDIVINANIPKMSASRATALAQLTGKYLTVIAEDLNGQYWLCGETIGLKLTERPAQTGAKRDDTNGYTLTLSGYEPFDVRVLDDAVVTALGL